MSQLSFSSSPGRTDRFLDALLRHRRAIIGAVSLVVTAVELYEHRGFHLDNSGFDIIVHVGSLLTVFALLELLARLDRQRNASFEILDRKHRLIRQLSLSESWEAMTQTVVELPGSIADVDQSLLLLSSPPDSIYEPIARWAPEGRAPSETLAEGACDRCPESHPLQLHPFQSAATHQAGDGSQAAEPQLAYCLPIPFGRAILAMLRFRLKPGQSLLPHQADAFASLVDEIAVALQVGLDSRSLAELRIAEATLRERRRILRDVHDHLGQNLGYIRLKLDHFTSPEVAPAATNVRNDLERMRDVADESYLIVRDMLEGLHTQAAQPLADQLRAHGLKVARRANLEFSLTCQGEPLPLTPPTQHQIFSVYREVLNNVERHARASKVEVRLDWGCSDLGLTIADNGRGFDQAGIDTLQHIGLAIIRERIAELKGRVNFESPPGQGTVVSLSIPL